MKKKLLIIFLVAAGVLLTACSSSPTYIYHGSQENKLSDRFVYHEIWGEDCICVDTETGCCYLFVKNGYGAGLCQLTDANGLPLIWDGE